MLIIFLRSDVGLLAPSLFQTVIIALNPSERADAILQEVWRSLTGRNDSLIIGNGLE